MWKQAGLLGLLYVSFFQLYFLFAHNRILIWTLFLIVMGVSVVRLLSHVGDVAVRRWVLALFFLGSFVFVVMYVSVIEVVWLRYVGALGFSLIAASLLLLLSAGQGDIRSRPRSFVTAIMLLAVLLMLFSASFFHSLKLFFSVRTALWPFLVAVIHALIAYLSFVSFRFPSRAIVPSMLGVFMISFQGFWVLEFLPFGPFILGLLHTIPLVFFLMVERDRLLDDIRKRAYIRWSVCALVAIVLMLTFARWS